MRRSIRYRSYELLAFLLLLSSISASKRFGTIPASIFGGNRNDHAETKDDAQGTHGNYIPPPPPPPKAPSQDQYREFQPQEEYWEQTQSYPGEMQWGDPAMMGQDTASMGYPYAIEDSLERERNLLIQIDNLTAALAIMEQRDDLHSRQMDVLTERVMDVEAQAAAEHNELLELRLNCTELARQLAIANKDIDDWKSRCDEYKQSLEKDKQAIEKLKKDLKKASLETEDLAAMVERQRLSESTQKGRKKEKKRGFFAWLFGIRPAGDEDFEDLQDRARSTLLGALQSERQNVEELESVVETLQRNNSAISEQVRSRDLIIDELNERVAVFEEDKVVLKAALRQLQKEMSEEAPRTQKLRHDLKAAYDQIDELREEIEALLETHHNEIALLQDAINDRENSIAERESNLTVIGNYVDKLEERLADFAVARRDIERRETACAEKERTFVEKESQVKLLQGRLEESNREHEELKALLNELATARSKIQNEATTLKDERTVLQKQIQELNEQVGVLKREKDALIEDAKTQQNLANELQLALNATQSSSGSLESDILKLKSEIESLVAEGRLKDDRLEEVQSTLARESEIRDELEQREAILKEELKKLRERPPPPAPKRDQSVLPPPIANKTPLQAPSKLAATPDKIADKKERKVLFRKTRKFLSHTTGLHGLITPPSNPDTPKVSWKLPTVQMPKVKVPEVHFEPKKSIQDSWTRLKGIIKRK